MANDEASFAFAWFLFAGTMAIYVFTLLGALAMVILPEGTSQWVVWVVTIGFLPALIVVLLSIGFVVKRWRRWRGTTGRGLDVAEDSSDLTTYDSSTSDSDSGGGGGD